MKRNPWFVGLKVVCCNNLRLPGNSSKIVGFHLHYRSGDVEFQVNDWTCKGSHATSFDQFVSPKMCLFGGWEMFLNKNPTNWCFLIGDESHGRKSKTTLKKHVDLKLDKI